MEIHGLNTESVERTAKLVRLSARGRESKELSGSSTAFVLRDVPLMHLSRILA